MEACFSRQRATRACSRVGCLRCVATHIPEEWLSTTEPGLSADSHLSHIPRLASAGGQGLEFRTPQWPVPLQNKGLPRQNPPPMAVFSKYGPIFASLESCAQR